MDTNSFCAQKRILVRMGECHGADKLRICEVREKTTCLQAFHYTACSWLLFGRWS